MLWKSSPIPMCQFMWYPPGTGKGTARPYIGTICFPSTLNIEQDKMDEPMTGVGNNISRTPAPSVDNVPAGAGWSGMVTSSMTGSTPQGSPDEPAPLRHGTQATRNQLPWRYWNFGLLADAGLTGIWDAWIGLCVCLHIVFCLYTVLWGSTV